MLEMVNEMERLRQELKRLRGEIEAQSHELDQMDKRQRQFAKDSDNRLREMEATRAPSVGSDDRREYVDETSADEEAPLEDTRADREAAPPALPVDTSKPPPAPRSPKPTAPAPRSESAADATKAPPPSGRPPSATEQAAYDDAFNLLKMGRYDQSIDAFNGFLAQHPGSKYADSAQYWLGETYYVKHEFESAISEYTKLVQNHPQSPRLTQALLKIGYSYHELGQDDRAKQSLNDLKKRYPGTTAARLADERLRRMKLEQ
jgi:tol-pal system protein YbgF